MTQIHPTAVIDDKAQLGENVQIGPFCCVGPKVVLGDGVRLISHVTIAGRTYIGADVTIYPFASIGHPPQDLKYNGEDSQLIIGDKNTIREYVTLQPGTAGGGMVTQIGSNNLFMVASHIAHDCQVGNHVIMANGATLGGHVQVEDHAIIGGLSAVHQFVRIGAHAIIGGMSGVEHDVIPYGHVKGERANLSGLNLIGLKRRGFSTAAIQELRSAYQDLFESTAHPLADRVDAVGEKYAHNENVMQLVGFIRQDSPRSLCLPQSAAA
ncbi:MAG: lpxA [Alphaproteobacteria bacterium]|jgi:UDP-N-acetylglucosamine acyltransferase|nr:lpxA [Alphaproteobacteria bacterium]